MKLEVTGAADLQAALRELGDPRAVRVTLRAALREAARPMLESIKGRVPVDQGDLQRSIKMAAAKGEKPDSPQFGIVIGIDQNEQPARIIVRKTRSDNGRGGTYRDPGVAGTGPITEFGRPGQPATPMFRPGFDAEGEPTIARFADAAGRAIERTAARIARKRGSA